MTIASIQPQSSGEKMEATDNVIAGEKKRGSESTGALPMIQLKVLPILKERQQQHGLRHSDYQRYRGYCSRRLRRLRETLKMPQGDKRHYKKKDVALSDLESPKGDSRYLEIPLTMAERGWAYAMELKEYANTEPRKRYHCIARLQKAMNCAKELLTLATDCSRVDARTKLECEAYSAFIHASFYFEMQLWSDAIEAYKKTQTIYSQIGQALGDHPEASVYDEKIKELLPSMRFCAYQTGAELDISELSAEFQSAAIEAMIAQRPKMSEFMFREHKITVPSEKLAALLVRLEDFEKKSDKQIEMYEEILVDLRDAIQTVRDSIRKEEAEGKVPKASMLLSYLIYLRLKVTNSRTELMILEKTQPKDCVRLLDMILHNLQEMKTIQDFGTDDFQNEVDTLSCVYKGIRCRYFADSYKTSKKWNEALALCDYAEEYFQKARKALPKDSPHLTLLAETEDYVSGLALECKAQVILTVKLEASPEEGFVRPTRPKVPLDERLDEFVLDEGLMKGEPNLARVPPDFEYTACKPMYFDLVEQQITYPIEEMEEAAGVKKSSPKKEGGGLTGLVKGLWGWGGSGK
jgi:signal recognition particle subunit SRP68